MTVGSFNLPQAGQIEDSRDIAAIVATVVRRHVGGFILLEEVAIDDRGVPVEFGFHPFHVVSRHFERYCTLPRDTEKSSKAPVT